MTDRIMQINMVSMAMRNEFRSQSAYRVIGEELGKLAEGDLLWDERRREMERVLVGLERADDHPVDRKDGDNAHCEHSDI